MGLELAASTRVFVVNATDIFKEVFFIFFKGEKRIEAAYPRLDFFQGSQRSRGGSHAQMHRMSVS